MALMNMYLGDIRGSLAALTFSRNRDGAYVRSKVTPVNPNTTAQVMARARLAEFADQWGTLLTEVERQTWRDYAAGTPFTNVWGNTVYRTGIQNLIRSNTLLRLTTFADRVDAPGTTGQATPATPQLANTLRLMDSASVVANSVRVETTELDGFADTSDVQALVCSLGVLKSPGVGYFSSPFSFRQTIQGNSTTSPGTVDIPVGAVVDPTHVLWLKFRRINSNGRASPETSFRLIAETV